MPKKASKKKTIQKRKGEKMKKSGNKSVKSGDIRYFFKNVAMKKSTKLPRNEKDVVVLD